MTAILSNDNNNNYNNDVENSDSNKFMDNIITIIPLRISIRHFENAHLKNKEEELQ